MVGYQKIIIVGIKRLPSDGAVFGGVHVVTRTCQCFGVESADVTIVIYYENTV